jgi:transcriptional regulator with XRE-family HTH domain
MSHPLGNLLRHFRTARGDSLRSLASRMECSGAYISKIEVGKSAPSDPDFLRRLSNALELSTADTESLFRAADTSKKVIELSGELSPTIYSISHLFARRIAYLTAQELAELENILNRVNLEEEDMN